MIYKNSYLSKELRRAYIENKISTKREFAFGFFLGLVSFAIHFVLQTLTKSVLTDAVPEFMQPSYFSTLYTYILSAFVFTTIYFLKYYEQLSFEEIRRNRWYMLVKMGYEPITMIFSKLFARLFSVVLIYTLGFVFTIFLTVFLKYTFVYEYFLALYITGLIDLIIIVTFTMTASLYLRNPTNARYFVFVSAVSVILFKSFSGFYKIASNRVLMQNIYNLFDIESSIYLPLAALVVLFCIVISIFRAGNIAKYYCLPHYSNDPDLPDGVMIAMADSKTGEPNLSTVGKMGRGKAQSKILNFITGTILVIIVVATLMFNLLVLIISMSQPGKEVAILGVIPYVFKTDTMEPEIMENDLAFFEKLDVQDTLSDGEIVLFMDKNTVYIERIVGADGGKYVVDIDNYPEIAQKDAMRKTISRNQIYGVYTGRNRWLGALILFANTIIGRLVFLLVPAVLLFFYKPITDAIKRGARMD